MDRGVKLYALGDSVLVVEFRDVISREAQREVLAFSRCLEARPFEGFIEYVPAFTTVSIVYDPLFLTYHDVRARVLDLLKWESRPSADEPRTIEIPVCYGGEFGPDLTFVARHNGLSEEEVIRVHSSARYVVHMIGFAPGFPYLGGMPEQIATPRLPTPRVKIPVGSVGIAGSQTGVYPVETPGGWQLIGKTPIDLFRPKEHPPSLLQPGDTVTFVPITPEKYGKISETGEYP